jgi:peptidyl-tRNA hydrolase, PTH1 family
LKYLIAGLGNIGSEYTGTRHNIGFITLDAFAKASNVVFETSRFCEKTTFKYKGRTFLLIKPSTYMNLSGKAIKYWLDKEGISKENLLVILDDLALPFATLRIRAKGSNGGHNGLKNIDEMLEGNDYARMRFGIGNNFGRGKQIDYVLEKFSADESKNLSFCLDKMNRAIINFGLAGINDTMNRFNGNIEFSNNVQKSD